MKLKLIANEFRRIYLENALTAKYKIVPPGRNQIEYDCWYYYTRSINEARSERACGIHNLIKDETVRRMPYIQQFLMAYAIDIDTPLTRAV